MSGSAKFRRRTADATAVIEHLDALTRLAAGRAWAREALQPDSPMLFVSTGGFKDSFHEVARDLPHTLLTWTLDDLF